MSKTPFADYNDEAVEEIRRNAYADSPPKASGTAAPFKLKPLPLPAGCKWFSEVFGWKPQTLPRDVPVPVFDPADWDEEVRPYIPESLPNNGLWSWPRKSTELLALALYSGDRSTLTHGPTASGKTSLWEAFGYMCRIPVIKVSCHGEQQSTDFLGKDIITTDPKSGASILKYDWSLCTTAAKKGGILLIDEAFRSPVLMSIQSLLERNGTLTLPDAASLKPNERKIKPPKGKFWIGLTDNTNGTGDDSGAYNAEVQDLSTLSRITAVIEVPYPDVKAQAELLKTAYPAVPDDTLEELSQWAGAMRDAFLAKTVLQPICLRVLLSILAKYELMGSLELAINLAYMSKLGNADKHCANEAFHAVTCRNLLDEAA